MALLAFALGYTATAMDAATSTGSTVVTAGYRLGPGDVVAIGVWGHEDLAATVEVRPDGYLSFPLAGEVRAEGRTPSEVAEDIAGKLKAFVRAPQVTAIVTRFRTIRASVLGAVRQPGAYELLPSARLADLLGLGGGLAEDADAAAASLTRQSPGEEPRTIPVDLSALFGGGELRMPSQGLVDGDVLFVPKARPAAVMGEVRTPGAVTVRPGMRIVDLLAAAGGLTPAADPASAKLTRRPPGGVEEVRTLDLARILVHPGDPDNVSVQPGDMLYVPVARQVLVLGAVRAPGAYQLPPGSRLLDGLAAAGGIDPARAGATVSLSRAGQPQAVAIDLDELAAHGDPGANVALAPGDVLFVSESVRQVAVLGEVVRPGGFAYRQGMTLADALAQAGGLTREADGAAATLTRVGAAGQREVIRVDLRPFASGQGGDAPVALEPGDLVVVPRAERQVLVLGAVRSPGVVPIRESTRLLEVLAQAGGVQTERAGSSLTLIHPEAGEGAPAADAGAGRSRQVDLARLLQGADPALNVEVQPGDVVVVSEEVPQVAVLGEVVRPGGFAYRQGMTLADALAQAGGLTREADGAAATLTRVGAAGQREVIRVDLRPFASGQGGDAPVALEPGDLVVVPRAERQVLVLGAVRSPGVVPIRESTRLLEVLAQAGGVQTERAGSSLTLIHPEAGEGAPVAADAGAGRSRQVDLARLLQGADPALNVEVQPGDVVVVSEEVPQVAVLGEVVRPGTYPIPPGGRVLDVVAMAGGLSEEADPERLMLTRRADQVSGEVGRTRELSYTVMREANGSDEANPLIRAGDVIVAPRADVRVLAMGAVRSPGSFPYREGLRVLDLLALAGGPAADADRSAATLSRQGGPAIPLDVDALVQDPASPSNVALAPGDLLFVPEARQVLVLGEVRVPGAYRVPKGARVLDVIALAGGVNPDATVASVLVTRPTEAQAAAAAGGAAGIAAVSQLDYARMVSGSDLSANPAVHGGDVVYVPASRRHVLVLGQVRNPGLYVLPTPGPAHLLDVLAMAGGPTSRAVLDAVGILRADGTTEKAATGRGAVLFQGRAQENPSVQAGDVVYVPESRWPDWSQIAGVLGTIKTFAELVDMFRN